MDLNRAIICKYELNDGIILTLYLKMCTSTPENSPKYALDSKLSVTHTLSGCGGKDNIVTPEEN
jgi:hypothetical protein